MRRSDIYRYFWILLAGLFVFTARSVGQETKPALPPDYLKVLQWRSIGPANMGGRITALAVYEADPSIFYVATASGGLLKTTNNGITFTHQFDREMTVSIGDVCVAPSNADIVWVGTGESNPRNSVSYGDGVYKSTDGGKTWQHMGLKQSFQIGKILIHPQNPDIVYVGALGRLYGPNKERGLFKTTDGGRTWDNILFVDDDTGVIDMRMHPGNPDTMLVATWERRRDEFDGNDPSVKHGEGSRLYKTTDGGESWKRITDGLPTCKWGRIGLDYFRDDPNIVYMILDSEKIGGGKSRIAFMGISGGSTVKNGVRLDRVLPKGPAFKSGLRDGDIIREMDKVKTTAYDKLIGVIRKYKPGDEVVVEIIRNGKEKTIHLEFGSRGQPFSAYLGGQRENMQKKQGDDGFQYGGVYKSNDGGESWTRVNSLNPRPMYFSEIRVDPVDSKKVYVLGVNLHRSNNGGESFRGDAGRGTHPDHHALWIDPQNPKHMILGNDGGLYVTYDRTDNWDHLNNFALGQFYHVAVGPRLHYKVYGGLQDNGTWGGPCFTKSLRGPLNADWFRVGGADGFRCAVDPNDPDLVYFASQFGGLQRRHFRTGEVKSIRPRIKGKDLNFNWNTPFLLSHHNSRIYYCAANYVIKSIDRGDNPQIISPKIANTKRGTASALAESPRDANVLYVGTDDGALWVTKDSGKNWTQITNLPGLPGPRWVSSIECSRFEAGRAYVVLDAHRSDDDNPYVYATEDFGKTWKTLHETLPWGTTRVLREDLHNENLLYLGTEFGAWCSLDRGESWIRLNSNLPTVAVHEIAIHPDAGEIVAATHGRSLWTLDVSALRQLAPKNIDDDAFLFKPNTTVAWRRQPTRGVTNREFRGDNKPIGAVMYYSLPKNTDKIALRVEDVDGKTVAKLRTGKPSPGLHRVTWGLTRVQNRRRTTVEAGTYRVVLTVDGQDMSQPLIVINDPTLPPADAAVQETEREEVNEEKLLIVD